MIMEEALGARVVEGVREATELSVRAPPAPPTTPRTPPRSEFPVSRRPVRARPDGLAAGHAARRARRAGRRLRRLPLQARLRARGPERRDHARGPAVLARAVVARRPGGARQNLRGPCRGARPGLQGRRARRLRRRRGGGPAGAPREAHRHQAPPRRRSVCRRLCETRRGHRDQGARRGAALARGRRGGLRHGRRVPPRPAVVSFPPRVVSLRASNPPPTAPSPQATTRRSPRATTASPSSTPSTSPRRRTAPWAACCSSSSRRRACPARRR